MCMCYNMLYPLAAAVNPFLWFNQLKTQIVAIVEYEKINYA